MTIITWLGYKNEFKLFFVFLLNKIICCLMVPQSLLLRENLEKQCCDVGKQESYLSVFRKAAVKNVIPDPEYDLLHCLKTE